MNRSNPAILLTVDVEDWFQVENLRPWFPRTHWDAQPSRVESNTQRLLDLFDSFTNKVKATFFILGWIAEKYPTLVRRIKNRGHEVASHGYNHQLNYQMDKPALQEDLRNSKLLLEDISGEPVSGYRAPCFSINDEILEAIRDAGYAYDSSFNSFERHGRYGRIKTNSRKHYGIAFRIENDFFELPISNLEFWGQKIPWGGGGYFRLIPYTFFRAGVGRILRRDNAYMMYLHPWEIDPDQPRGYGVKGLPAFRHYLNLHKTYARLKKLITKFQSCRFYTCRDYLVETTGGDSTAASSNHGSTSYCSLG
jgi:polysaccharide deacetylase family protein (PEP-CTERM system associated)